MVLMHCSKHVAIRQSAVARLDEIFRGKEDVIGIRRIDRQPAHVKWALVNERIARHQPPTCAAVVGTPHHAFLRLNNRVNALSCDCEPDAAHQTARQSATTQPSPRETAVGRFEDAVRRTTAAKAPRRSPKLPHTGENDFWIARIDRDV